MSLGHKTPCVLFLEIFFILSICTQLYSKPLDVFSVVQCCQLVQRIDYFYANRLFFNSLDILFCYLLLPPANKVWGKVIFLHQFVILFTGGCLLPGGACSRWGACFRGCLVEIPRMATAAGGMHPTGMHSCY